MIRRSVDRLGASCVRDAAAARAWPHGAVAALPKPASVPERPFAPPPRVERTLPNGLR